MQKILIFVFTLFPSLASASTGLSAASNRLGELGGKIGVRTERELPETVGLIISIALQLIGTIFLILTVYAGFLWLTARGEEAPVEKARKIILTSVIGLVVVVSAYAITQLVMTRFVG